MLPSYHAHGSPLLMQKLSIRNHLVASRISRSRTGRANVVCFSNIIDDQARTPWHTLAVKHVVESQQFDKVREYLQS